MKALRIALPKGRLLAPSLELFVRAGFEVPSSAEVASRTLVFDRGGIEWILVKDGDVPVYVEHGAAGAGIAGLDQILEQGCTAYQPVTLPFGRCRMMVIGTADAPSIEGATSVATKYPRMAREFLAQRRLRPELVTLGGSVELAAVLRLTSHVIDLVESGETVRVHDLRLQDTIADISPRLIIGRDAYRTEPERMRDLIERIQQVARKELIPS